MAKEVIVTAILLIASVIAVVAFVDAVIPSVYDLSNSYSSLADNMGDQFKTAIDIVFIYPNPAGNNISVWIKNVGSTNIPLSKLGYCDIFVLSSSNYWNPRFESSTYPSWNYTLVNGKSGDMWNRGETIQASIYFDNESLPRNTTQITFFLYNGVSASDKFSM
jgi:archaeal flagellar protein FlaG